MLLLSRHSCTNLRMASRSLWSVTCTPFMSCMMERMDTTGTAMQMPNVAMASSGSYRSTRWMRRSVRTGTSERCMALYVRQLMACTVAASWSLPAAVEAMLMNVVRSTVSATILPRAPENKTVRRCRYHASTFTAKQSAPPQGDI